MCMYIPEALYPLKLNTTWYVRHETYVHRVTIVYNACIKSQPKFFVPQCMEVEGAVLV